MGKTKVTIMQTVALFEKNELWKRKVDYPLILFCAITQPTQFIHLSSTTVK